MSEILSREALHALVWHKRLRDLVSRLGHSEPTLRKRCRDKDIPLPTAGHWARLEQGREKIVPLPPRGPGMDELIAFPSTYESPVRRRLDDEQLLGPIPDAPVFIEPLGDIRAHYAKIAR